MADANKWLCLAECDEKAKRMTDACKEEDVSCSFQEEQEKCEASIRQNEYAVKRCEADHKYEAGILKSLKQQLDNLRSVSSKECDTAELTKNISSMQNEIAKMDDGELRNQIASLKLEITDAKTALAQGQAALDSIKGDVQSLSQMIKICNDTNAATSAQKQQEYNARIETILKKNTSLMSVLDECKNNNDATNRLKDARGNSIRDLKSQCNNLQNQINQSRNDLSTKESDCANTLQKLQAVHDNLHKELAAYTKAHSKCKSDLTKCNNDTDKITAYTTELQAKIEAERQRIIQCKAEVSKREGDCSSKLSELQGLQAQLADCVLSKECNEERSAMANKVKSCNDRLTSIRTERKSQSDVCSTKKETKRSTISKFEKDRDSRRQERDSMCRQKEEKLQDCVQGRDLRSRLSTVKDKAMSCTLRKKDAQKDVYASLGDTATQCTSGALEATAVAWLSQKCITNNVRISLTELSIPALPVQSNKKKDVQINNVDHMKAALVSNQALIRHAIATVFESRTFAGDDRCWLFFPNNEAACTIIAAHIPAHSMQGKTLNHPGNVLRLLSEFGMKHKLTPFGCVCINTAITVTLATSPFPQKTTHEMYSTILKNLDPTWPESSKLMQTLTK